jgi:hypothetical protein
MARINDIVISEMTFNRMLRKMHNSINYPAARLREIYKHNKDSDENIAKLRKEQRIQRKIKAELLQQELLEKNTIRINKIIENDILKYLKEDVGNQLVLKETYFQMIKNYTPDYFNKISYDHWGGYWSRKNDEFDGGSYDSVNLTYCGQFLNYYFKYKKKYKLSNPSIMYELYDGVIRCYLYEYYNFIAELKPFEF